MGTWLLALERFYFLNFRPAVLLSGLLGALPSSVELVPFVRSVDTPYCTGMAIVCNMGGATTSLFPDNPRMADYLKATKLGDITAYTSPLPAQPYR
jgi:hypothetical protein